METKTLNASIMVNGKKQFVGSLENVPVPKTLHDIQTLLDKKDNFTGNEQQIITDYISGRDVRLQRGVRPKRVIVPMDEQTKRIVDAQKRITDVALKNIMEQINVAVANNDIEKVVALQKQLNDYIKTHKPKTT